jgi:hypothetical protein
VLCGLLVLLALGLVSGTAVAGLSGSAAPGAITGTISVTTAVPTAPVPTVTVALPVTTVTSPTTVPTLPVTVTVPVTTAVTVPTTTAPTTTAAATTARLPVTTTAPAATATSPATTVTSTATAPTGASGPAAPPPGSTSQGGAGSTTEPAPPPDRDASGGVTSAPGRAIGTGFQTHERRTTDLRRELARPRATRETETAGAGGSSLPRSPADGTQNKGTRVEAAPVGFIRPSPHEGRGPSSAGDLVADVPRVPLGVVLLGLAALLVAIAAIPREAIPPGRLGALVADRRLELVSVGATVLVTAVLTLALA